MARHEPPAAPGDGGATPREAEEQLFDREISIRSVGLAALSLVVVCVVAMLLMRGLLASFHLSAGRADPRPPAMREAREPQLPPEPRLQSAPPSDLGRIRVQERYLLDNYGWVDRPAGLARIPIAKAMEILAASQLPVRQEPAEEAAPDAVGAATPPPAPAPGETSP